MITAFLPRRIGGFVFLLALALLLLSSRSRAAQGQEASPKPDEPAASVVIPKAVFADDSPTGKDPFFPDSRRRVRASSLAGTNTVAQSSGLLSQLVLKGISRAKGRPLALINTLTLSPGEQGGLKLGDQKVQVRCLEIRDRSVIVTLEGTKETRELDLRKGL